MKLTVVGCSPAWPNPGGAQSGYLLEGPGRLLMDCGPRVLARLRSNGENGWPQVDAIVITHFHLDHWGDLVPWVWGLMVGPAREEDPPEESPALLILSAGTAEAVRDEGFAAPVLLDPEFDGARAFGADGTPMAVLVGPDASIRSNLAGGAPATGSGSRTRASRGSSNRGRASPSPAATAARRRPGSSS